MNRGLIIASVLSVLIAGIIAISLLTALHDDSTLLIGFITASVIPTITALLAFREANSANVNSGQAVRNTNGLLHAAVKLDPESPAAHIISDAVPSTETPPLEENPS